MPVPAPLRDLMRAVATGHDARPGMPAPFGRVPPWAGLRPYLQVWAPLTAFLLSLCALAVLSRYQVGSLETILMAALTGLPVALLPGRALWAWRVAVAATVISGANHLYDEGFPWPGNPVLILVYLVVLVVVGYRHPPGVLFWVWSFSIAMPLLFLGPNTAYGGMLLVTVVLLVGHLLSRWAQARAGLVAEQERGAMLTERARIARELHDVVAHHMSLIAVRSETAAYRLEGLPPAARAEFGEISQSSRQALTEMRRLLGVLRSPDEQPSTAPQPGLADLGALVAGTRAAGTPVALAVDGNLTGVPDAVDLSAYRIVQEALSNAARHAPGAPVDLMLRRTRNEVSIRVRNEATVDGGDRPAAPADTAASGSSGQGLRGMRERVAMLHGRLNAEPTEDGGFEVQATLPLDGQT